jgi:hypothetical protein
MKVSKVIAISFFVLKVLLLGAQSVELRGRISANAELEGIYVLNITAQKFTVSNSDGSFNLPISLGDDILVSSVQYEPVTLKVDQQMMNSRFLELELKDRINALDEVIVGKILTGNLISDIENSDAERDINFYDVGIPGYTGKRKTQTERRLYEADNGDFVALYVTPIGLGLAINLHKILNRISGRTNEMKNRVRVEAQELCMTRVQSDFSDILFGEHDIEERLKFEFFLYVSEDPNFLALCNTNNGMAMFEFLTQKLLVFAKDDELVKN